MNINESYLSNFDLNALGSNQSVLDMDARSDKTASSIFKENYLPTLFSFYQLNGCIVSAYLDTFDNKKILVVEVKNLAKHTAFKERFDHRIDEGKWYSLVLTINPKGQINVYINSKKVQKLSKANNVVPLIDSPD